MRALRWWLRQGHDHAFDVFCCWLAFGWGVNLTISTTVPVGPHEYLQAFVPGVWWGAP